MPQLKTTIAQPAQPPGPGPGQSQELYEPARAPSVASDVAVPLLQATVSAALVGLLCAIFAYVVGASWRVIAHAFIIAFGILSVVTWFWRMGWVETTIEKVESWTGADLNGDGYIPPHAYTVSRQGQHKFDPVAFERARLQEFISFAYEHGTDIPTLRSKFNDKEIGRFRGLLMQSNVGAAMWKSDKHHNQGWFFVYPLEKTLEIVSALQWEETRRV